MKQRGFRSRGVAALVLMLMVLSSAGCGGGPVVQARQALLSVETRTPVWLTYRFASGVVLEHPAIWRVERGNEPPGTGSESAWFYEGDAPTPVASVLVTRGSAVECTPPQALGWPNEGGYEVLWSRPLQTGELEGTLVVWARTLNRELDGLPSLEATYCSVARELQIRLSTEFSPLQAQQVEATALGEVVAGQFAAFRHMVDSVRIEPGADPATLRGTVITIECLAVYRSDVSQGLAREERTILSTVAPQQVLSLGDLTFHARYWPGDVPSNEHALRLSVTPVGSETELVAQLFQLPQGEAVRNQFEGEHGFTGLSYVYHPISGAELQYTCKAQ